MLLEKPFASSKSFLAIVRAENRADLARRVDEAARDAGAAGLQTFAEFASQTADIPSYGECCVAVVADSLKELTAKLERAASQLSNLHRTRINDRSGIYFHDRPLGPEGRVAFLFPGEGSQYENALADLPPEFPELRELLATPAGEEKAIWDMRAATRMVLSADVALLHVLRKLGVEPDAVAGHSTGEIAALFAAGMFPGDSTSNFHRMLDGLARAITPDLQREIGSVTLIAAGTDRATAETLVAGIEPPMQIAMHNCPHQTVIVGDEQSALVLNRRMLDEGILYEVLPFDRPYHTQRCAPLAAAIREPYESLIANPPAIPVYSCTAARLFPAELRSAREMAVDQWTSRVEFPATVEAMYADGIRIFVESGPRGNLSAFVSDILRGRPHSAIPADVAQRPGLDQLVHLIAQLTAHGVRLNRPNYAATDERAPAIAAHLRFMERFYGAQQTIMLAYLERLRTSAPVAAPALADPKDLPAEEHSLPHASAHRDDPVLPPG